MDVKPTPEQIQQHVYLAFVERLRMTALQIEVDMLRLSPLPEPVRAFAYETVLSLAERLAPSD